MKEVKIERGEMLGKPNKTSINRMVDVKNTK